MKDVKYFLAQLVGTHAKKKHIFSLLAQIKVHKDDEKVGKIAVRLTFALLVAGGCS